MQCVGSARSPIMTALLPSAADRARAVARWPEAAVHASPPASPPAAGARPRAAAAAAAGDGGGPALFANTWALSRARTLRGPAHLGASSRALHGGRAALV
mmetsp:Transcript_11143/g.34888  ORF Transcript_11143/g.34888 Transcript_11143/m.34888 type:complete len:100 (-) Transcript_11143:125-424(-)